MKELIFYLKSFIKILMILSIALYLLDKYSLHIYSNEKFENIARAYKAPSVTEVLEEIYNDQVK